jgi:hypothetical protein
MKPIGTAGAPPTAPTVTAAWSTKGATTASRQSPARVTTSAVSSAVRVSANSRLTAST